MLSHQVAAVMSSVKQVNKAVQACEKAQEEVQNIIGEIDTSIVFAESGALDSDVGDQTFINYRFVLFEYLFTPKSREAAGVECCVLSKVECLLVF